MAKRRGITRIFKKLKKTVSPAKAKAKIQAGVPPAEPVGGGGEAKMPLPIALGSILRGAVPLVGSVISSARRSGGTGRPVGLPGFFPRRRRKGSLTATEMGKITFMAQTLGKRNPAVTLIVMKALGGKL